MNKYAIYCTEKQTQKALELGAPISVLPLVSGYYGVPHIEERGNDGKYITYLIPTAEQIIGWIEEDKIKEISIYGTNANKWNYEVWIKYGQQPITKSIPLYASRKEATLAAIDAGLEYLINNR